MNASLANVKNIILIASGKGGVGKSTVATNLAVSLARDGFKTGIFDADLYGPSIPIHFGINDEIVNLQDGDQKQMTPIVRYGVKVMSIGFLIKKEDALIWRGPMVSKAITELIENTSWGELDYLIFDLPPGTGDISITLAQKLPNPKVIVVITPQEMAVADGRRAAHMFSSKGIDVPILGVVENMSWFVPETHPNEKYFLFGNGGGSQLAKELEVPLLAQIPLTADACELGDKGKTIFDSDNPAIFGSFSGIAKKIEQIDSVII